ncbi:hypothetical protein Theba_2708 [Mesotoga prima MesG1.Ag.4.2]|jgi:hypothetical protein|uniref:Uncharacterized protein n=1 Tax=Mesotoga prima MesG1.Ag.4.2 TaxID=660470 RepID=I2F8Q4_9BACT|nr:hypothetical protein Theba_2708 [Mesotoga prima MesG1.Ag.4.2]
MPWEIAGVCEPGLRCNKEEVNEKLKRFCDD